MSEGFNNVLLTSMDNLLMLNQSVSCVIQLCKRSEQWLTWRDARSKGWNCACRVQCRCRHFWNLKLGKFKQGIHSVWPQPYSRTIRPTCRLVIFYARYVHIWLSYERRCNSPASEPNVFCYEGGVYVGYRVPTHTTYNLSTNGQI